MKWFWTWDGISFGYREKDDLFTHDGRHVGRFYENEIYSPKGYYIGEIMEDRLITNISKKQNRKSGFSTYLSRIGHIDSIDQVGYIMVLGYEDFSKSELV